MKQFLGKIWGILGVVVSASSVFSLLQRGFEFPLSLSLFDFLSYYRELIDPIFQFCYKPIYWIFGPINIPSWLSDAQTLSFVSGAIYIKTKRSEIVNGERVHFKTWKTWIPAIISIGFTLAGLLWIPIILAGMIMFPIYYINHLRWYPSLKWYQFKKVIHSTYVGAGSEGAPIHTSAIFGYLTTIVVIAFYIWNRMGLWH